MARESSGSVALRATTGEILLAYVTLFIKPLIVFIILTLFWGDHLAMSLTTIWAFHPVGLLSVWFIFAWAALFAVIGRSSYYTEDKPTLFGRAMWASINAGFWEELIYRWLVFGSAMITLVFLNWLTFGLVHWIYMTILIPITNWLTFGALAPQLYASNWVLGAAIVSAAASFRDAHEANGLFGYVNSWFMGMVFFWLMFHYGIFAAMLAHALYDMIILGAHALKSQRNMLAWRW